MTWLAGFFTTPARQALGWTALGLLGIAMAGGGVWFLTEEGGGGTTRVVEAGADDASPTANASATARSASPSATTSPSATASASATVTETATVPATATNRPVTTTNTNTNTGNGGAGAGAAEPDPTATPVPEPTPPPVVSAGGDYCPSTDSSSSPPNSVFGLFRIGGVDVPAGATVSLAFDGVVGPSRTTASAGGYRVDYNAAPSNCANRVGAAISVVYDGVAYPTGFTVGGNPAIRADIVN